MRSKASSPSFAAAPSNDGHPPTPGTPQLQRQPSPRCLLVSLAPGHDTSGTLRSFLGRWLPQEEARGEVVGLTGEGALQVTFCPSRLMNCYALCFIHALLLFFRVL